jgi:DNA-binding NarL/FixJ family response regulator
MPVSVILADDHQVLLQGLSSLMQSVGIKVIGVTQDRDQLLPMILADRPDVAVVDISMPGVSIPQMLAVLREQKVSTAVLILTGSESDFLEDMLAAGVRGYMLKEHAYEELMVAIRAVAAGKTYVSPLVSAKLILAKNMVPGTSAVPTLTTRQLDVLRLIASGNTSKRIASILGIHIKTIDSHRRLLREKLGVRSTAEMIRVAKDNGLI